MKRVCSVEPHAHSPCCGAPPSWFPNPEAPVYFLPAEILALPAWKQYLLYSGALLYLLASFLPPVGMWTGARALLIFEHYLMVGVMGLFGGRKRRRWLQVGRNLPKSCEMSPCPP